MLVACTQRPVTTLVWHVIARIRTVGSNPTVRSIPVQIYYYYLILLPLSFFVGLFWVGIVKRYYVTTLE